MLASPTPHRTASLELLGFVWFGRTGVFRCCVSREKSIRAWRRKGSRRWFHLLPCPIFLHCLQYLRNVLRCLPHNLRVCLEVLVLMIKFRTPVRSSCPPRPLGIGSSSQPICCCPLVVCPCLAFRGILAIKTPTVTDSSPSVTVALLTDAAGPTGIAAGARGDPRGLPSITTSPAWSNPCNTQVFHVHTFPIGHGFITAAQRARCRDRAMSGRMDGEWACFRPANGCCRTCTCWAGRARGSG